MEEISTQPPNAIVFICDPYNDLAVTPEYDRNNIVSANEYCISVGTQAEFDGDTLIRIINGNEYTSDYRSVFKGFLTIPSGFVAVQNIYNQNLYLKRIFYESLELEIKVNDTSLPSVVELYF